MALRVGAAWFTSLGLRRCHRGDRPRSLAVLCTRASSPCVGGAGVGGVPEQHVPVRCAHGEAGPSVPSASPRPIVFSAAGASALCLSVGLNDTLDTQLGRLVLDGDQRALGCLRCCQRLSSACDHYWFCIGTVVICPQDFLPPFTLARQHACECALNKYSGDMRNVLLPKRCQSTQRLLRAAAYLALGVTRWEHGS